uniref:glycosyltransferase family 2 protein n=1 Tax=Phascolarctobacterium succinatutens TaxID=626940 RepID=UPI003079CB33
MPRLSVIVPVYKVEKYIHKCVDSILNQTFKDFELILIDDGSPDNCGEICDEYAKKDSRVRVIHKENGGQSSARNRGLDIAKGEIIGFVDSDDDIEVNLRLLNIVFLYILFQTA